MTIKTSITRIAIIAALTCGAAAALTPAAEARGFGHGGFHGGFHGGHGWGGHRWGGFGYGYGYGYRPYYSYSGYGGC